MKTLLFSQKSCSFATIKNDIMRIERHNETLNSGFLRFFMAAVAIITAVNAQAHKIEVVDADGQGIPLVSVLTEDGYDHTNFVMSTDHWEYTDKKSHVTMVIETYATAHGVPALSPSVRQAIKRLKRW